MLKELVVKFKDDAIKLALLTVVIFIIIKIAFFNEEIFSTAKISLTTVFVFILPGFFWTKIVVPEKSFTERVVVGVLLSSVIVGIGSYYLGLLGIGISILAFAVPLVSIAASIIVYIRKAHSDL